MARGFAERGAKVVISSWNKEELEQAKNEMTGDGLKVESVFVDVSNREQCKNLIDYTIDIFGSMDVMICNAGIDFIQPAESFQEEAWNQIININLKGYFHCAQFAAGYMLTKNKGSIIMTSSVAGAIGIPGLLPYAASKGGINQLIKTMAVEWAKRGVRVNGVAPGYIENIMADVKFDKDDPYQKRVLTFTPMERRGALSEFIGPYIFLASDASSYVTGEILYVDGGYHAA